MRAAELRGLLLERRSTDTGLLPEVRALLVMRRVTYSMRTAACGAIQALRATPPDTGCFKSSLTMERPPLGDLSFMAATELTVSSPAGLKRRAARGFGPTLLLLAAAHFGAGRIHPRA